MYLNLTDELGHRHSAIEKLNFKQDALKKLANGRVSRADFEGKVQTIITKNRTHVDMSVFFSLSYC